MNIFDQMEKDNADIKEVIECHFELAVVQGFEGSYLDYLSDIDMKLICKIVGFKRAEAMRGHEEI